MEYRALGDVAEVIPGTSPKGEFINSDGLGYPFFQGVKEFGAVYPIPERYTEKPVRLAKTGDILFSVRAPVGRTNVAPFDCAIGRGVMAIRPNSSQDRKHLLYFLRSIEDKWDSLGSTGSVFESINVSNLRELNVTWPKNRLKASEILWNLDEKIRINQQIASTLEKIAQTIFKSWFVDFDPVHAKARGKQPLGMDAETAALFPDSFEESELGPIPIGWRVQALSEFTRVPIGGLWGSDEQSETDDYKFLCLRGVDMDDLKFNAIANRIPVRWNKKLNVDKRRLSNCDVLIGASGAGPVGKSMLWDSCIGEMLHDEVIFSNFVKRFNTENESLATYLWQKLDLMYESGEIFTFVNGTSVPNIQDGDLLSATKIAMPSIELLQKQNDYVRNFMRMKFTGENSTLEQLRDSLLPRLLSGELEIPAELLEA